MVFRAFFSGQASAARAAVEGALRLDAVADHATLAMCARRRERVDRALERIERVPRSVDQDLEALVVVVPAGVADHTRYARKLRARDPVSASASAPAEACSSPRER